jgi:hypothetical protein
MQNSQPEGEPLDVLLGQASYPSAGQQLREDLLRRTTGVVRRRRWLRRALWVGAMAACYVAGVLSMRHGDRPKPELALEAASPPSPPATERAASPAPAALSTKPSAALALEWRAADGDKRRVELYRQAAEQYKQAGDFSSALRCLRNSLDVSDSDELAFSVTDDWLLMALKEARQREHYHAKKDS